MSETDAGPQTIKITELAEGEKFAGLVVWCVAKTKSWTREGNVPFVKMDLKDRSGRIITAVLFTKAEQYVNMFRSGDVLRVHGMVEVRNDVRCLRLDGLEVIPEEEAKKLLPATYRDFEELDGYLEFAATAVSNPYLEQLVNDLVLDDEEVRECLRGSPWTNTPKGHHKRGAGALEHTIAVAMLAQTVGQLHPELDVNVLVSAAILRSLGKVGVFNDDVDRSYTLRGRMLNHGGIAVRAILANVDEDFPELLLQHLLHCIENSESPPIGGFASSTAKALYLATALDANVNAVLEPKPQEVRSAGGPRRPGIGPVIQSGWDELGPCGQVLKHLVSEVYSPYLRKLLETVLLGDERRREILRLGRCTGRGHHRRAGEFLEHTVAVARIVEALCDLHPRLDSDLLMTAAILHDVGRARAWTHGSAKAQRTAEGILRKSTGVSMEIIWECSPEADDVNEQLQMKLAHCIESCDDPDAKLVLPEAIALRDAKALDVGVQVEIQRELAQAQAAGSKH